MIIDAHAHAAGPYSTADSIIGMSRQYRLGKIVLCTSPKNNRDLKEPPNLPFFKSPSSIYLLNRLLRLAYRSFLKDCGDGNQYVFRLWEQLPEIVIPFLWVNPLNREQMNNLEVHLRSYPARGIKLHQAWDTFAIDRREFSQLAAVAAAHRLPIFIHLYSRGETQKLVWFVGNHPEVTVIVAHMLGLDSFKEKRGELGNVYFDTSGSERVRGQDILEAIELFGYDHVLFGSDTPYARLGDQIAKIEGLKLSKEVQDHIFRLNIERVLSGGA